MADSTTSPFSITRLTETGDTEVSIDDKEAVGLEYGVANDDTPAGVISFSIGIPQRIPDVPVLDERQSSRPATGLVGVPIKFTIIINETKVDQEKLKARFKKFGLDEQTVRGKYTEGRFGLRNDSYSGFPEIVPTIDSGLRFVSYVEDDQLSWSQHQIATVEMLFVGKYAAYIALLEAIG